VETKQGDHGKDYRAEKNLSDMVVQDLLIRARRIVALGLFTVRCFNMGEGFDWVGYVLLNLHVVTPFAAIQDFPCTWRCS